MRLNAAVSADLVRLEKPDAVIVATGAHPYHPVIEGAEDAHVVDAWAVLEGRANPGGRVLVADWRCDWVGVGLAEKLAREGRHVRLAVTGTYAGQNLQPYLRATRSASCTSSASRSFLMRASSASIPYRLYGSHRHRRADPGE